MRDASRPRIELLRRSRGLISQLHILQRLNGPRGLGAVISVLIIGVGQVWTCLRKHHELMRGSKRSRVLLISHSG